MQLSQRAKAIKPSATLAVSSRAKELRRNGREIIDFAAGEPNLSTPEAVKDAAIAAMEHNLTRYTPVAGISELLEAIRTKFGRDNNLEYDIPEIVVASGAKQIIYNAFQALCQEGDEVIVPCPYWVSYPEQVKLANASPVYVDLSLEGVFDLDLDKLEWVLNRERVKGIILNSPHNPTGGVLEKESLERIGELLLHYPVWIISDEIYEHYTYGVEHTSLASLDSQLYERTLTVNGVSKTYGMTGWRIGYAGGPSDLVKAMARLQSHSTSCASSISQWASVAALKTPVEEIITWIADFAGRRESMIQALSSIPGVYLGKSNGAFYLFPDFHSFMETESETSHIGTSLDLAEYLLEAAGVATVPGSAFGQEGHLRVSYCVSRDEIDKGTERMREALNKLRRSD